MPVGANVRLQFQAPVSHRSFMPNFTPQFHAPVSWGTTKNSRFMPSKKTHPYVATLHIPHTAGQTHALNSHALELRWSSWTAVEHADLTTDPTSDFVKCCCCCCILSIEAALLVLRHWLSLRLWLPWERLGIEALALSSWQQRQQKQNYT